MLSLALTLPACAGGDKSKSSTALGGESKSSGDVDKLPYDGILALAAMQEHDYKEAIRLWTNVLDMADVPVGQRLRALTGRGASYAEDHELAAALSDANEGVMLKPDSAPAHSLRGRIYLARREYLQALEDFDTAIGIKPDYPEALAGRGDVHRLLGQFELAIADYDQAISTKPYVAAFYVGRGGVYLMDGRTDRALADFNEAVRRDSRDAAAYKALGLVLYGKGDFAAAATDFAKCLSFMPNQPYVAILLHLARLRMKTSDETEFAANIAKLDLSKWTESLVKFYQGNLKANQLRMDATTAPPDKVKDQTCEAEYYLAEDLMVTHRIDEGKRGLTSVLQICPADFTERELARMELGSV